MNYKGFKKEIVNRLQEILGEDTQIEIRKIVKNNGASYDGLCICINTGWGRGVSPVTNLSDMYETCRNNGGDVEVCIEKLCRDLKNLGCNEEVFRVCEDCFQWEFVRDKVYPVLISTEKNRELLKELVSVPLMDMSIVYMVRFELPGNRSANMKISRKLLKGYRISAEELQAQAMENMKKEGYGISLLRDCLGEVCGTEHQEIMEMEWPQMYILTNACRSYGAAGILDRKLLREFAGDRNFYILPSSVHEMLLVPADNDGERETFNSIVAEVNKTQVEQEERLTDHCYYYDAGRDEIRMCG